VRPPTGGGDTLVRLPNHLGDVTMALPALATLLPADILVAAPLAELVALLPGARVHPLEHGTRGLLRAARELRALDARRGVLFTASFSSALLFALAGVPERRGTATDGRTALLTSRIARSAVLGLHRTSAFWVIATGETPSRPLVPQLQVPPALRAVWDATAPRGNGPLVGVIPGASATSRRWDPDRFAALVRRLADQGARVVVFGGPGERALTAAVASGAGVDMGGRTAVTVLAAGLASCDVVVGNDTGPLHLAAAVGARTVWLLGAADPVVTGPLDDRSVVLRHGELACVPCVRNVCPRSGPGYILPDARRECLRLIAVSDVAMAVERALSTA
jgi:lipopolysaccharide heptosyltransferase II